jgi:hypothetical protein
MGVVLVIWFTGTLMGALGLYGTLHTPVSLKLKLWCWGTFILLSFVGLAVSIYVQNQQDIKDQAQVDSDNALQTEVKNANSKLDTLASAAGFTVKGGLNDKLDFLINNLGVTKEQVDKVAAIQEAQKDYGDIAIMDARGIPPAGHIAPPLIYSSPVSDAMRGTYTENGPTVVFNTDAASEQKFRNVIAIEPRFPFSYFALAIILNNKGQFAEAKDNLLKARAIFEKTVLVPNHDSNHDACLKDLDEFLAVLSTSPGTTMNMNSGNAPSQPPTPPWSIPDKSASPP